LTIPVEEVDMRALHIGMIMVIAGLFAAAHAQPVNYRAHLTGAEEVAPVETRARGQATFQLTSDGMSLQYRLMVANIEDVTQAHIHLAPAGANGPIVAWLYPATPPAVPIPGRSDGVIAAGAITSADLFGPLAGQLLEDLLDAIEAGETYVNVHTDAHPAGEVRGQIR
jgi:hypothetical protein